MKKIILLLILACSFTAIYAQKANVRKAKEKVLNEDRPDFVGARDAIKLALNDSTTKDDAETWYVAGLIGNKQSYGEYKKAILNIKFDTLSKGRAVIESYHYLVQANKLDNKPDSKGKVKPRFAKEIKTILKDYYTEQHHLVEYGGYQYGKQDFRGAFNTFQIYLDIPLMELMNKEIKIDSAYNRIKYFAGVSASAANMHEKAFSIFDELVQNNFKTDGVYQNYATEYLVKKDTVNYLKILKEGNVKFPKQPWYMQSLINYYIHSNKTQDALTYLNSAIEIDPKFYQYYMVKGQLYLTLENFEEANKSLNKAIELNPTNSDLYAELGRSYFNKAVKMSLEASKIKEVSLYKKEEAKADEVLKLAIPYYLKAIELKPKDVDYKTVLKQIYYRLQMDKEYEAINKEIKALS